MIVSGRNAERGAAIAEEITQKGGSARFVRLDLEQDESVRAAAAEAGDVDILVNNAALATSALTVEQNLAELDAAFAVNVRGAYLLVQLLAPAMLRKGQGSIVNISTMIASNALPGRSVYAASKAAVEALTRTWAVEFSPSGVRVNTVAPGPVGTRRSSSASARNWSPRSARAPSSSASRPPPRSRQWSCSPRLTSRRT